MTDTNFLCSGSKNNTYFCHSIFFVSLSVTFLSYSLTWVSILSCLSLLSLIISHPSTIPTKEHHLRSSPTSFQPPFSGQLIRNILKAAPICCTVFRPAHLPPSSHRFPASNPPPTTRREQHATLLLSSATAPICCLSLHIRTDLLLSVSLSEPMSKI